MAAGAADRQSEEGRAGGVHDVGQLILTLHESQVDVRAFDEVISPGDEESRSGIHSESIASNLLPDELIIRLVVIQRLDDIVAIRIGVLPIAVRLESVGFGEAGDVQPVSAPAFTIAGAGQNTIHQLLHRIGPGVADKLFHFFRRGRESVHHEVKAPDERATIGCG